MTHLPVTMLFDNLELAVIAVGKRDPVIRCMGRRARAIARFFGLKAPNALAAPRLEALRLLVIALRRREHYPSVEVAAALANGFSQEQIDCLSIVMAAATPPAKPIAGQLPKQRRSAAIS